MLTNEIQDQIDNYLLNKMTMAERAIFEKQLSNNSELIEKLEIQRLIIAELQYRRDFERIVKHNQSTTLKIAASKMSIRKIMLVAWSAAAIFIGAFFVNQAFVNNRMDNLYSQYYASPEADVMRGGEYNTEQSTFIKAIELIQEQPEQALEALQALYKQPETYTYYEDVRWYMALTELKLHNKREAIKYLKELLSSEFYGEKASKLLEEL